MSWSAAPDHHKSRHFDPDFVPVRPEANRPPAGMNPLEAPPPPFDRSVASETPRASAIAEKGFHGSRPKTGARIGQPEPVKSLITKLDVGVIVPRDDRRSAPFELVRPKAIGQSVIFSHQKDYHCKWGPNHGGQPSWIERHKIPHAGELVWLQFKISKGFEALMEKIAPSKRKIIDRGGYIISFLAALSELREMKRLDAEIKKRTTRKIELDQQAQINEKILNRDMQPSEELKSYLKEKRRWEKKLDHATAVVEGLKCKKRLMEGRYKALNMRRDVQ
jgi:hypothetical protein